MCGIVGILLSDADQHVSPLLVDALTLLQHRGQDAAGIATVKDDIVHMRKDNGLVNDIFDPKKQPAAQSLVGNVGLGHCRYPTAGSSSQAEAQPLFTNCPYGVCLAHNGNLVNTEALRATLREGRRHLNTDSDSEILLNLFAIEMLHANAELPVEEQIFGAIENVMKQCQGGYAVVMLIVGIGLIAFRDPHGIRPLITAKNSNNDVVFASESVVSDVLGFSNAQGVAPGEVVIVRQVETGNGMNTTVVSRICHPSPVLVPCVFEFVYFARPDSVIDGVSVYRSRLRMGNYLASQIQKSWGANDIDVVVPVPDTARPAAQELAHLLRVPHREALIKNRYVARTFIMPGQTARKKGIRMKLSVIRCEVKDKVVLLVDDSIVRGNTAQQIVSLVRGAGAKKVYFASAAPEVRFQNVYGIDMPTREELVASSRNVDEVCQYIGADKLIFLELQNLIQSIRECAPEANPAKGSVITPETTFECSCFDGHYITGVTPEYLQKLQDTRNDSRHEGTPAQKLKAQSVVEIHNAVQGK